MPKNKMNKMYFILLPNGIKYRISQGEKLGTFRFDENGKISKVSTKDALNYIRSSFDVKDINISINMDIVPFEKRSSVLETLYTLMALKQMAPRHQFVSVMNVLKENETLRKSVATKSENNINDKPVEQNITINLPANSIETLNAENVELVNKRKEKSTFVPDWVESVKVQEGLASSTLISENAQEKIKQEENNPYMNTVDSNRIKGENATAAVLDTLAKIRESVEKSNVVKDGVKE